MENPQDHFHKNFEKYVCPPRVFQRNDVLSTNDQTEGQMTNNAIAATNMYGILHFCGDLGEQRQAHQQRHNINYKSANMGQQKITSQPHTSE